MAVQTQIQLRRGTAAQWTSTNPTLASGEMGVETDTGYLKIGNGTSAWTALSYQNAVVPYALNQATLTSHNYTIVITDNGKQVEMSDTVANTITVPPYSSVASGIGTTISILQTGVGQTTITPGSGVTINANPGLKLRGQWSYATLIRRSTSPDTWVAVGDLTA
jgi:hypothetical protein